MKSVKDRVRLVLVVGIIVAVGAVWNTTLQAESDAAKPSLKEIIEKRSKASPEIGQVAAGIPDDPLGRGTPRSSVRGFLSSAKDRNYAQAAEYLDLRNLPPGLTESQGPELARQLWIVLDRSLWIDLELLSAQSEGDQSDNLPVVRERVGRLTAEGKLFVVEANPNPQIARDEDFSEAAAKAGISYDSLIERIVRMGLRMSFP